MKRKHSCKTCIFRTKDKQFLALERPDKHPCHEDDFGLGCNNPNPSLCWGNSDPKGTLNMVPMFTEHWNSMNPRIAEEIMETSRRNWKLRRGCVPESKPRFA